MKSLIGLLMLVACLGFAAPSSQMSIENSCKIKAKEVAAETYKSCVTDSKAAELEKIKKSYQAKLKEMKAQYESELKKLGAQSKVVTSKNEAPALAPPSSVTITTAPELEVSGGGDEAQRQELPVVESPISE